MFDNRGLPDYPPAHNAWQFPPPPVSTRWKWLAILVTVVGLVVGSVMLVAIITIGSNGVPGLIDDPDLISVIEDECETMTATVESMIVEGSPQRQAATIADQNEAVDEMIDAIRAEGTATITDDRPAQDWLNDWERLVAAREAYALMVLEGGEPDFDIPQDSHGDDIYFRMEDAFIDSGSCEVPGALLNPYPQNASDA